MLSYHALSSLRCLRSPEASRTTLGIGANIFLLFIIYFIEPFGPLQSTVKNTHLELVWLPLCFPNVLPIVV